MGNLFSILIAFVLIMSFTTTAENFGSVARTTYERIDVNSVAKFDLLFWSLDENARRVRIVLPEVENITVIAEPAGVLVGSGIGNEIIQIGSESIRAALVKIIVISSNSTGNYDLRIMAEFEGIDGDISFIQERVFNLKISVGNTSDIIGHISEEVLQDTPEENTRQDRGKDDNLFVFYAAAFIIILVSAVIYRR